MVGPTEPWPPAGYDGDLYKSMSWVSQESNPRDFLGDPEDDGGSTQFGVRQWGWKGSIRRSLMLTPRLIHLIKAAKVRGLDPTFKSAPSPQDKVWIDKMTAALIAGGLVDIPVKPVKKSTAVERFLRKNGGGGIDRDGVVAAFDGKPVPSSYLDFMSIVGPWTFDDVDGEEGRSIRIVPPGEIDTESYGLGKVGDVDDDQSRAVDGIMFGVNESGDCFCFDVSQPGPEYPVMQYLHEMDMFEGYAANFTEFLDRVLSSRP